MKNMKITKISLIGVMIAAAMLFSYVESMIPVVVPVPGVKLGLANLIVLLSLYLMGEKEAFLIGLIRVCLSALLFGNVFSFFMSLFGFLLSFFVMLFLYKTNAFSCFGVSLAGGAIHNITQLIVASFIIHSIGLLKYTFLFTVIGIITGLIIGFLNNMIFERVKHYDWIS